MIGVVARLFFAALEEDEAAKRAGRVREVVAEGF